MRVISLHPKKGQNLLALCALLEDEKTRDAPIIEAFDTIRAEIWTFKYHESINARGKEKDGYDHLSQRIALCHRLPSGDIRVIGGCRIIRTDCETKLPTAQTVCDKGVFTHRKGVEISRFFFITPPGDSCTPEAIAEFTLLISALQRHLVNAGYECAYATVRHCLYLKLKRLRVNMERIGAPTPHGAKKFIPVRLTVSDL